MTSLRRRPDIQGLRAVAVLLVVAYHAGLDVPGGFGGVDLFFAISGFVIVGRLLDERERDGRISLRAFYARRVRRIVPALATMLTVTAVLGIVAMPFDRTTRLSLRTAVAAISSLANVQLNANVPGYFTGVASTNPWTHTWSLSVEEQLYVVIPVIVVLVLRRFGRPILAGALAVLAVGSFASATALAYGVPLIGLSRHRRLVFFQMPFRAWEFLAGALLVLAVPWLARRGRGFANACAAVGVVAVAVTGWWRPGPAVGSTASLAPIVAGVALIAAGVAGATVVTRVLSMRPLVWLGDRSYAVYLWHLPVLVFVTTTWSSRWPDVLGALVLTGALSVASYRWVEQPLRAGTLPAPRVFVGAATASVAGVAVLALALGSTWGSDVLRAVSVRGGRYAVPSLLTACTHAKTIRCTVPSTRSGPVVYLIGDSHAASASPGVADATRASGWRLEVRAHFGCPIAATTGKDASPACRSWLAGVTAEIVDAQPRLVLVEHCAILPSSASLENLCGLHPGAGGTWTAAVERALAPLAKAAGRVDILGDAPTFDRDLAQCVRVWRRHPSCGVQPVADARRRAEVVAAAEDVAVRRFGGERIDTIDAVCGRQCAQVDAGVVLWRDTNHLAPDGARRLTPLVAALLARSEG